MHDLIVNLYNKVFKSTNELSVVDVLVIHYHYAYTNEPFHSGIMDRVGIDAHLLSDIYNKLVRLGYLDSGHQVTVKGLSIKNNTNAKSTSRSIWFDKFWSAYPIKIGKKKSREIFMKIKMDKQKFDFIYESLQRQIKYRNHMDSIGEFYPKFKHPERWLRNEEWDNEVPDVQDKKIVKLNRK